ncbi:tyrosine-type recombinase/integrase [Desulfolucanica intricata]|uniref:tyrosine-type recombinase/integrase n=1 Tax=Desulfolucanica intricata TaxID=1285191 RepID=UPI0008332291|nr:tyrosine-type recombinase/integrase [Desulfolucanica intricata]
MSGYSGHVEKRYKSSWTIIIEGERVGGKRKRITKSVKGTKKEAEKIMHQMITELNKGIYIETNNLTFEAFLEKWLEDYAKLKTTPKTFLRYEEIIKSRIIPDLGKLPMDKLKPMHLQQFYAKLLTGGRKDGKEGGLSPTTVMQHHRIIHKSLDTAVKWQIAARNVADAVEPPQKTKHEIVVLDETQVRKMLDAAQNTPYFGPILLAVTTGMRRGEILGLRWQDVEWNSNILQIRQTIQYTPGKGIFFKQPKTVGSYRPVKITSSIIEFLKKHKLEQAKIKLMLGPEIYEENGLVFCQDNGKPMHPDSISSWFPAFMERNWLPKIRFHDLRHTHATLLLKQGIHPKVVSERLGHAGISITMDIYSHLLPGMQEEAASKIDQVIFGEKIK